MNCPDCQSQEIVKNGRTKRQDGSIVQKYLALYGFQGDLTEKTLKKS